MVLLKGYTNFDCGKYDADDLFLNGRFGYFDKCWDYIESPTRR
jgi:hypothetical protein